MSGTDSAAEGDDAGSTGGALPDLQPDAFLANLPSWDSLTWRDKLAFINGWLLVSGLACLLCIIGSTISLANDVNYVATESGHQLVSRVCLPCRAHYCARVAKVRS